MSELAAILLGILQGLTEFLPVSSSGHIELGKALLGVENMQDDVAFTVILHGATVLSIIVVFYKDILQLLKSFFSFSWNEETQYLAKLALSAIPVGLIGVLLEDYVEELFSGKIVMVGVLLIITGFILFLTKLERPHTKEVGFMDALWIGLAQTVAILPGISRSGSTISTALALGIDKEKATRFSFLMVLAPILGATLLKFKDIAESPATSSNLLPYILGFIAAFVSGLFACRWMIDLVKNGKIIYFSYYCFAIGLLAIIWGLFV